MGFCCEARGDRVFDLALSTKPLQKDLAIFSGGIEVGVFKQLSTFFWAMKELGKMLKHIQGFGEWKGQNASQFRALLFPALPPVLNTLIREVWAIYSFLCLIITLTSSSIQKHAFNYPEAFTDTSAQKGRKKGEDFGAGIAEISLNPNPVFSTPASSKSILDNLACFLAVGASLYGRESVILFLVHIFFDINAKIMYYHHVKFVGPWRIPSRIELSIPGILQGFFFSGLL